MKQTWVKSIAALVLGTTLAALAAEQDGQGGWTLRLGASYREFYDVRFDPVNFVNWGNATVGGVPYGVQDVTALNVAFPTPVPLDYVRWNGGYKDLGSGDSWAPVVGVGKDFVTRDRFRLGFVGNLQYYSPAASFSEDGTMAVPGRAFSAAQYTQIAVNVPNQMILPGGAPNAVPTAGTDTRFWMRNRFSADLFVLDAGLEAKVEPVKCLNLVLAGGPSLNLADVHTLQDYQASWTQPAGVGAYPVGPYHRKRSESDFDVVAGLYGAVGLMVALDEKWSLAALYRYDYVPEGIGTDQAEVSLNGPSGQLMLIYRF
jgi:hypothetical protein